MTENEAKLEFASLLLKHPENVRMCAEILCASVGMSDEAVKTNIITRWPFDPTVRAERERLLAVEGSDAFLPTKSDLGRLLWGIADSKSANEDRLKAAKQYAELMGFVQKQAQPIVILNKVMQVKDFGNDDDWEMKALAHQNKLLQHEA